MKNEKEMNKFWEEKIKPRFSQATLNFPIRLLNGRTVRYINLDNAATTPSFIKVIEGVKKDLEEYGSVHRGAGEKSKISTDKFEKVRATIKKFVNARESDYVLFVPNTTSGINQLAYFLSQIKGKIMVSEIEHSSSLLPWIFNEGRKRASEQVTLNDALSGNTSDLNKKVLKLGSEKVITYRTKEDFSFDLADIKGIFKDQSNKGEEEKIKLIVVTGASNVTGYKPPIKEIAEIAHKHGAMIAVDACQLLQHEKIDIKNQKIDFALFSGHKMYAPFGSGAIVGDKRILDAVWPYQMGGGNFPYITADGEVLRYAVNQAHDPGTPNFAGARALHYAIEELERIDLDKIKEYEHALVNEAFNGLKAIKGVKIYTKSEEKVFDRSLITFNLEGFHPKLVAEILNNEFGIGTRAGSYCVYEFSRRIAGTDAEEEKRIAEEVRKGKTASIPGSVRASFSLINNLEDVDRLIAAIKEIASKGQREFLGRYEQNMISGVWKLKEVKNGN